MKQPKPLTDKQQRILAFILRFSEAHPYAPSIRDIQAGCQLSSSSVASYHLYHLERAGLLTRETHIARSITLTETGRRRAADCPETTP